MGLFGTGVRRSGSRSDGSKGPMGVPSGSGPFVAVAEALAGQGDVGLVCAVAGRSLARDGADLGEALRGLDAVAQQVTGREPDFAATRALCTAWAEETLAYLHQLSCEDPLTGLASLPHLRARLGELYRVASEQGWQVGERHALMVVWPGAPGTVDDPFGKALRLTRAGETVRLVFPAGGPIARAGAHLLVLVERTADLGLRARDIRALLEGAPRDRGEGVRVWIEGLPPTDDSAGRLLDELAR